MASKTPTSVVVNSLTSANVTYSDGSTTAFGPNPILDLIANNTVSVTLLQAALVAFVATQTTATATASTAATTAQAALATLQGQVNSLVLAGQAAIDFPTLQGVLNQAAQLASPYIITQINAAIAAKTEKHTADIAALQAQLAAAQALAASAS